jgi:hypothetical protein
MWVFITNQLPPKNQTPEPQGYGNIAQIIPLNPMQQPFMPSGVPIKITAVSHPFIVGYSALNPEGIATVDMTRFEIRKADKAYVNRFTDHYLKCCETQRRPNVE